MLIVEILTAPGGGGKCEEARRLVSSVIDKAKIRFAALEVREWNLAEHPELGPRYGVMATPAIVLNGRLEFSKVPGEKGFVARLEALARHDGD